MQKLVHAHPTACAPAVPAAPGAAAACGDEPPYGAGLLGNDATSPRGDALTQEDR